MTVRRLAEIQPASFAFTAENEAWAQKEIAKFPPGRQASAILPLLWRAQEQNGYWLSKAAIEKVATLLDMPLMRALEVATFYSMFNLSPVGRHHVQLCGTTPCMLRGSDDLKKVCEQKIGAQNHVTTDGALSWVEVECLGACCNAPMVQINNDYYEDLDPQNFTKLLDDLVAREQPLFYLRYHSCYFWSIFHRCSARRDVGGLKGRHHLNRFTARLEAVPFQTLTANSNSPQSIEAVLSNRFSANSREGIANQHIHNPAASVTRHY